MRPPKINEEDVVKIKELLRQGMNQRVIAEMFGINKSVISRINTGKIWWNVTI